jgi:hypothetical protein
MTDMEFYHFPKPEGDPSSPEPLIELLEFPKSPELAEARQAVLDLLKDPTTAPETLSTAWIAFADAIELIVEKPELDQHTHTKLQIGAIVYKALIFKDAGNPLRYVQELDDAELYAFNIKLLEISVPLQAEIDTVIETLPLDAPEVIVLKLKGKITDEDRLTLLDSIDDGDEFDDVLGTAYGMLDENGFDPDAVLKKVGLIE